MDGPEIETNNNGEIVQIPIDGTLDLHGFKPREIAAVVEDYLEECLKAGISEVRFIHGKGIGQAKQTVHSVLAKHRAVVSFHLDYSQFGGHGATLVKLRKA